MTLTYNPNLAKVKVDLHTKNQGRRSNGSAVRGRTDGQTDRRTDGRTDGRYQVHYLPRFAVDNYARCVYFVIVAIIFLRYRNAMRGWKSEPEA